MDRLKFIERIDHGRFVCSDDSIIQFFDHTMAAYNIVGRCENIEVTSKVDSPLCMTFTITTQSDDQAKYFTDKIVIEMKNQMQLYGKTFSIVPTAIGNTINIQILQTLE